MIDRATFVPGHARPKGSLKPQEARGGGGRRTGRVRLVENNPESSVWRRTVAQHVERLGWAPIEGPCSVEAVFWFDPAFVGWDSAQLSPDEFPIHSWIGDLDKLVRNVLDALQDAGVYGNDRQVVGLGGSCKRWALTHVGQVAGLSLRVWPIGWPSP